MILASSASIFKDFTVFEEFKVRDPNVDSKRVASRQFIVTVSPEKLFASKTSVSTLIDPFKYLAFSNLKDFNFPESPFVSNSPPHTVIVELAEEVIVLNPLILDPALTVKLALSSKVIRESVEILTSSLFSRIRAPSPIIVIL